jgi:hypothetical protein
MKNEIVIVRGPSSTRLTKEAAATALQKLDGFPKDADFTLEDIDGRWVAAVVKKAEFPPSADDSAPSGPPSDGPSGPPADDGASADSSDGEDKPKEDKKEDGEPSSEGAPKEEGKLSVEHQLANLTDMLTKITDALGLSTPADGMVPGADDGAVPPPGGETHQKPGEGGPADPALGTEPGVGSDNKMHTVHERSLKPGEAPPGTTPVGAPSFASVQVEEDHPWKAPIEARVKEFEVESVIGDQPLSTVASELKALAAPYGYIVTDLAPSGAGNQRTASARIVRTR